jgi:hypothetical protein
MINVQIKKSDSFNIGQKIFLITTQCLSEDELKETWRDYRNFVASEYQTIDIDEFERWNFYIFYVVKDKNAINRSLKYEIEHDTISSRKIIVSESEFSGDISNLENKYICFDLENVVDNSRMVTFEKDPKIKVILKGLNDED